MKKIKVKTAGIVFLLMMTITIVVHLLVIGKLLPYEWVNGGNTVSYNDAVGTAVFSIVILLVISLFTLISSTLWNPKLSNGPQFIVKIISWILVLYFAFAVILQFMGTKFEMFFMGTICIISLLCILRIAVEKR